MQDSWQFGEDQKKSKVGMKLAYISLQQVLLFLFFFILEKFFKSTMKSTKPSTEGPLERISVSIPAEVLRGLDRFAEERGFDSRSQTLVWMIREHLREDRVAAGDAIMAGSITLFFRQTRPGILEELGALKRRFVDEVIATLQVQLTDGHLMDVLLVQGPVGRLQEMTDQFVACKGVKAGRLTLTSDIIPPIHPLPAISEGTRCKN